MHDFFFHSPEMCCHKSVCDLRLKKWKCRGDLWNFSLFRGVFYYLRRACLHIRHSLSPVLMPGTATWHTHTPQSCVLIAEKKWYKRHIPQLSPLMVEGALIANIILIHTVTCRHETHLWQTSQCRPSSAKTCIIVPMTTRLLQRTSDRCAGATGDTHCSHVIGQTASQLMDLTRLSWNDWTLVTQQRVDTDWACNSVI